MFFVGYYGIQHLLFPSIDKQMMRMASEINKSCPIMIDQHTRLDNTIAVPKNKFQYSYTISDALINAINNGEASMEQLDLNITNNARTNTDMKFFREKKVTLVYYYKDAEGKFVHKLIVTPDMYK